MGNMPNQGEKLVFLQLIWIAEARNVHKEFAYFQFDHFPTSEIYSESRFEMRMSILLIFSGKVGHAQFKKMSWKSPPPTYRLCLRTCGPRLRGKSEASQGIFQGQIRGRN